MMNKKTDKKKPENQTQNTHKPAEEEILIQRIERLEKDPSLAVPWREVRRVKKEK